MNRPKNLFSGSVRIGKVNVSEEATMLVCKLNQNRGLGFVENDLHPLNFDPRKLAEICLNIFLNRSYL
jgi:hypothetical protein